MDIETFEKVVRNQGVPDEQAETAFNLLVTETLANSAIVIRALKLFEEHRPEIAKKVAREILATATSE